MLKASSALLCACLLLQIGCSRASDTEKSAVPAAVAESAANVTSSAVSGRAPAGALVVLEPANGAAPMPAAGALMDQFAKAFVPEMLFVRVGQEVLFRNSEDQLHNVTVVGSRTGTAVFDISQSPFDTYKHTFDRAGEFDVTCDIHPGMRATIVVTTTPYAQYADTAGSFSWPNVTPGSYKLRITANGTLSERVVEVRTARVDLGG